MSNGTRYTAAKRRELEAQRQARVEAELRHEAGLTREELAPLVEARLVWQDVDGVRVTRTGSGDLTLDEVVELHYATLAPYRA